MSVSYRMKHAKQHAWTIEEKTANGSKTGARRYLWCSLFVLIVVIGLISVTSMSTMSDYKSNRKECKNFLNQPYWKY